MFLSTRRVLSAAVLSCALLVPGTIAATAAPGVTAADSSQAQRAASPFTAADVVRSGTGWTVTWSTREATSVAVSQSDDGGRTWHRIARNLTTGSLALPAVAGSDRLWFRLQTRGGAPLELAARSLGLASVPNLRDAGGYRTIDGRWVRMGVFYRSSALAFSPADLAAVEDLGIRDVYDLRTPDEATKTPDVLPAGAERHSLNVLGTGTPGIAATTPEQARAAMENLERQMVTSQAGKAAYAELINSLATEDGAQLWHCTAGKDRTGWASAVVLTLLGVDKDTVMNDYLLSNSYYFQSPAVQSLLASLPESQRSVMREFFVVAPSYLEAGLDEVKARYGTMDRYVVEGLGVSPATVAKLQARLLTPSDEGHAGEQSVSSAGQRGEPGGSDS
jgi:protein-tyrosine phosphatase